MSIIQCNRRSLLKLAGAGLLTWAAPDTLWAYAREPRFDVWHASTRSINRFPRMVQEYYVEKVRAIERAANAKRMALSSEAEAKAYVKEVQDKIQRCFGPWPEKTPLNPRITGGFERDGYSVEKIIFESRPGFLVTANLYIPKSRPFPRPGVVGTCGHTNNGKAGYQKFAQGLVHQGYVVLMYDPIGQGERLQYVDEKFAPRMGVGVAEHLYAGNQQLLVGECFGAWRAWDGIRALDYLLTREEVDPNHVGVTGNSGGGTMTTWLCGVEPRWTMAAPSCFVTTFRRNLENELPQDTEQCPPMSLALGLDHADFLAANAPDPIIILAKKKDYFDIRGSEETYRQLKHLYKLLGAEDNIGFFAGEEYHGYTQDNREAMYRWFNQATGTPGTGQEPEIKIEKDETLFCVPEGQVAALGSKTVFMFTQKKSKRLEAQRPPLHDPEALKHAICETLRLSIPLPADEPEFRVLKSVGGRKYPAAHYARYAVETEPGIQAIVYRLSAESLGAPPPKGSPKAVLYIAHISSDYELGNEPLIREIMEEESEAVFYTCDIRGIGESRPDIARSNSFLKPYGSDYLHAIYATMLDEPYTGRKTLDVLRVLDWLNAHGHESVHLVGRGWGAIPATFAALLSDTVKRVTLKAAPVSYSAIAESEFYEWPLSTLLPNVLEHFDLSDCYRVLEHKQLRLIDPQGAR